MRQDIIIVYWWRGEVFSKLHRAANGKVACGLSCTPFKIRGKRADGHSFAATKLKVVQNLAGYAKGVCRKCVPKAKH